MRIPVSEVKRSPRGRTKEIVDGLTDKLVDIKPGQGISLKGTFGQIPPQDRDRISTIIRKHWKIVREDKPSISYSKEGFPKVTIRKQ